MAQIVLEYGDTGDVACLIVNDVHINNVSEFALRRNPQTGLPYIELISCKPNRYDFINTLKNP